MKRIAFITDVHLEEQFPKNNNVNSKVNFEKILADISIRGIDEIIFGGDIGDVTSHNYFFETLKKYSLNLIIGNHDKNIEVKKHFFKAIKSDELYYKLEDDYFKYIFLDSSLEEISQVQIEWLKLEIITNKKILIFSHHPIIEIETPADKLYPLKNREVIKPILIENGTEIIVFSGHYHMNVEIDCKNVKQFITQSTSFQIVKNAKNIEIDNSTFGYRILNIENDRIETEIINFSK